MAGYDSKSVLKKYRLSRISVSALVAAVFIAIIWNYYSGVLYLVSTIAMVVIIELAGLLLYRKFIMSILFREMDPLRFADVLRTGRIVSSSLTGHLYAAYFSGDYNTAINICRSKLGDRKCKRYKYIYLSCLARSYFEIGDFENLKAVSEMFKSFTASDANGNKVRNRFPYFKFVDFYLAGDFESARELYKKLYLKQAEKPSKIKLNDVSVKFTYAVCCYKCGDLSEAAAGFNGVITDAPLLHFAEISEKYLDSIKTGTEYKPDPVAVTIDPESVPVRQIQTKMKIIYFIILIYVLVTLIDYIKF